MGIPLRPAFRWSNVCTGGRRSVATAKHVLKVPAPADEVRFFLESNRSTFEESLKGVMEVLEGARKTDRRLAPVYKIYSRGEHQGGDELKQHRKVRLKFDDHWGSGAEGDLWLMPDIVGFTVVVPFPSNINEVNAVIDELVDARKLALPPARKLLKATPRLGTPEKSIVTKYGRGLEGKEAKGYFACHYNLRMAGGHRPIVEIQVKTLLYDAWGAKTHDLTYKPAGRTDQSLLASFDLLGESLATLDHQSDVLRKSMERRSKVRLAKRAAVQRESLRTGLKGGLSLITDDDCRSVLDALADQIERATTSTPQDEGTAIRDQLQEIFEEHHETRQLVCRLFCALAVSTGRRELFRSALNAIEIWGEESKSDLLAVWAASTAALAVFGAGDTSEAIDRGGEGAELLEKIDPTKLSAEDLLRYHRLANSLFSSLAYYHADQIGSHDGDKRKSLTLADVMLERSRAHWDALKYPPLRLHSPDDELKAALSDPDKGSRVFQSLDNEAYVRIQTAITEADAKWAKDRLEFLHENKPGGQRRLAECCFEYHDFCARARLAELEAAD